VAGSPAVRRLQCRAGVGRSRGGGTSSTPSTATPLAGAGLTPGITPRVRWLGESLVGQRTFSPPERSTVPVPQGAAANRWSACNHTGKGGQARGVGAPAAPLTSTRHGRPYHFQPVRSHAALPPTPQAQPARPCRRPRRPSCARPASPPGSPAFPAHRDMEPEGLTAARRTCLGAVEDRSACIRYRDVIEPARAPAAQRGDLSMVPRHPHPTSRTPGPTPS